MTVVAYTGLPGHGKSYSAVENVIIPALKSDRTVVHNLELNELALMVVSDGKGKLIQVQDGSTADELVALCNEHPGAVFVFDEVWQYWPAGVKVNEVNPIHLEFLKKHRHKVGADNLASEICIIDQDLGSGVAAFLRDLVELTFIHEKLSAVGAKGRFRVDVYSRAQCAGKPAKGSLIRKMQGKYRPEVWNCYKSHTQDKSKFGFGALEVMPDRRGNIWHSTQMRFSILSLCLMPLAAWAVVHKFRTLGGSDKPQAVSESPPVTPGVPDSDGRLVIATTASLAPVVESPVVIESKRWRFAGIITINGVGVAVLIGEGGVARHAPATSCTKDGVGDYRCVVDGETVAAWTGPKPSAESSFMAMAPSTDTLFK